MAKVTNITRGPKGGYNKAGELVMVEAGESADLVDFPKEWFKAGGKAPKDDDAGETLADKILAAIGQLDGEDDDAWTKDGKPAVDAVSEIVGQAVTRAQIDQAAPDGVRPDPVAE